MVMVNPQQRQQERKDRGLDKDFPQTEWLKEEYRGPAVIVGWEHYRSSKKGTPGTLVRFVCLDGPNAGKVCEGTLWKTQKAIGTFADLALALGWTEPFDPDNDDHLASIFSKGAIRLTVKSETYTNNSGEDKTSYKPAYYDPFRGSKEKAWGPLYATAKEGWNSYSGWRAENPRPEPSGDDGYGGGNSDNSSSDYSDGGGSDMADDDLPF